jgi:hypothetical protein
MRGLSSCFIQSPYGGGPVPERLAVRHQIDPGNPAAWVVAASPSGAYGRGGRPLWIVRDRDAEGVREVIVLVRRGTDEQ